jgi:hypothetical protein
VRALLWTGEPGVRVDVQLAAGAVVWLAYAIVWLVVNGPLLDEAAIAGQVLAGNVAYPAGHPTAMQYRHAPSLSYQLAGWQSRLTPSPWTVSAGRNVLFLFLSAFVPYAIVVVCTRRPAFGHAAAALTLSETACSAVGIYLMWVFPSVYSSGHVGIHVAVLAIVLAVAGAARLGGFLAGILPVLHGPMALVAWPVLALGLFGRRVRARPLLAGGAAGLLVSAIAAAAIWRATLGDVAPPPYEPGTDGPVVLRTFTETTDPHRQPLPLRSALVVLGPVAFAAFALVIARRHDDDGLDRGAAAAVIGVGAVAWTWALGTRLAQGALGGLPAPVLLAMPGRFANVAMLLVIPLAVVVIATTAPRRGVFAVLCGLVACELAMLWIDRHIAFTYLLYAIIGAALGTALEGPVTPLVRRAAIVGALAVALATVAVLDLDWLRLAGAFYAFVVAGLASQAARTGRDGPWTSVVLPALCFAVAVSQLHDPHLANAWDLGVERQSPDETALAAWLAAHAEPGDMLVAPLIPQTLLPPKTGHPVLMDVVTLTNMAYVPSTAGAIGRIVRDVYDVDYASPDAVRALRGPDGMLRPTSPVWMEAWARRSCADWVALGRRYAARFVVAPASVSLHLPVVWSGVAWRLHRIEADAGACPPDGRLS